MYCKDCGKLITKNAKHCRPCFISKHNNAVITRKLTFSGKKHSEETKTKIKLHKIGNFNPMWKGDNVGLFALHDWVRRRIPKPDFCENCRTNKAQDLANKGIYDRNLNNWEWLCRKCHMIKDGRIKKLIRYDKRRKK